MRLLVAASSTTPSTTIEGYIKRAAAVTSIREWFDALCIATDRVIARSEFTAVCFAGELSLHEHDRCSREHTLFAELPFVDWRRRWTAAQPSLLHERHSNFDSIRDWKHNGVSDFKCTKFIDAEFCDAVVSYCSARERRGFVLLNTVERL